MKSLRILAVLAVSLVWVAGSRADDLKPARAVAVFNENRDILKPVQSVMPLQDVLSSHGASAAPDDPSLARFLEQAIDLADPEFRNGDEMTVEESILYSYTNENGSLIEETLEITGWLGPVGAILRLSSKVGGVLRVDLMVFDSQDAPTERELLFQIFTRPSDGNRLLVALPGKCKCSKKGVTGCSKTMCEDGDTCPKNNGESCGFYTYTIG